MTRSEVVLRNKDVLAGILFLVMAAVAAYGAARLPMGTTVRMGSGYFPMLLSGTLAVFGLLTLIGGLRNATPEDAVLSLAWSRLALVILAVLVFVFGLEPLGFPLAVFGTAFVATTASRSFRVLPSLALSAFVAVVSYVLFAQLLRLPFRALGSWFAG